MKTIMKIIIALILVTFSYSFAQAATVDIQRETTGIGSSYQEALANALLAAVQQVRGVEVGTEKVLQTTIASISMGDGSFAMQGKESIGQDVYSKSQGWIRTYEVLEIIKPVSKDDFWQVKTLVTVPQYQQEIAGDTRKTIAVLPFRFDARHADNNVNQQDAQRLALQIADGIITELTLAGNFSVLNRAFEKELSGERNLWKSNAVSSVEASRLGEKLGADFILVGDLYKFSLDQGNSFYGANFGDNIVNIELFYSVIESATEKVIWAEKNTFQKQFRENKNLRIKHPRSIVDLAVDALATDISIAILDVIYPIKVMKITSNNRLLLNQGGKRLNIGATLEVFTQGEDIVDPDTGMNIRIDGESVALIEVVDVKPKYSVAKILSGDMKSVKVASITRRVIAETASQPKDTRPLSPGSSDRPFKW